MGDRNHDTYYQTETDRCVYYAHVYDCIRIMTTLISLVYDSDS